MKYSLGFIVLTLLFTIDISAQTTGAEFKYTNAIKLSPFNLGQAEFQASYEHYFKNRRSSILVYPSIYLRESKSESISGWQTMMQYRFYLTHFNKDDRKTFLNLYNYGFYAGLYGLYFDYSEDYSQGYWSNSQQDYVVEEFSKTSQSVEGGALLGLQIDVTKRILMDMYVGGGIRKSDSVDTYLEIIEDPYYHSSGVFDPGYTGVKPKVGFQLGILF